jgi:hypothetical protein
MTGQPYEQGQAFGGVIDVLEAVGAVYAIWGGLAVVAYGEPRFTQDMDVLLRGDSLSLEPFVRRLDETHYHVDGGAVRNALVDGGFFNVIHRHYAIKVDFYVPTERDLLAMLAERVYLPFDEMRRAAYLTATSVVAAKLRAYLDSESTRHLDDIAGIVRVQGRRLDERRLDRLAAEMGCYGVWRALWEAGGR